MNPLDELHALTEMFPETVPLFDHVVHIPSATTPEPYRQLLVHDHHMTVTMENFHRTLVDVRVLEQRLVGDLYLRKILLLKQGTSEVVQFGLVRFNFNYVTQQVRDELLAGQIPLGRVLINHNVLRHIDLGAILEIDAGAPLADYLQMGRGERTYGRMATIFCNRQPAVDLLEIAAPIRS